MDQVPFIPYLLTFMMSVAVLAGIPLAIATVSGLIISLLQAVTSIQDQTLSQTVKIVAIVATLLMMGGVLTVPLMNATTKVFEEFGTFAQ